MAKTAQKKAARKANAAFMTPMTPPDTEAPLPVIHSLQMGNRSSTTR